MKRAVLNVATNDYVRWQHRLRKSMVTFGGAELLFWEDKYPPGSPTHAEVPYAFKLYAIDAAEKAGYESAFWLDAGLYAIRPMTSMWEDLDRDGLYFTRDVTPLNRFCSDETLAHYGLLRDKTESMQLVSGAVMGFRFNHPSCIALRKKWLEAYAAGLYRGTVSKHSGQEDHRGDEAILGILTHQMEIPVHNAWDHFASDADVQPATVLRSGYYSRGDGPE